jgi:hypothetical protein
MIDYNIIAESVKYYEKCGFSRIESPWTVTKDISDITKPEGIPNFSISEKSKVLVASGEQSFLYLYNKGFLPKGKFQTTTPCFRDETFDVWHTKYFIKNELIITDDVSKEQLRNVIHSARDFFRKYCLLPKVNDSWISGVDEKDDVYIWDGFEKIAEVNVNDAYLYPSYDLMYRGVELGSYGIRHCNFLKWIYGTGVAEPRLSRLLETYGISYK